ncbi:hypothetical protein RIF29_00775 [Crotalaria pallida]|uniref:Uncharacterized protein n=1 Tax=Crotalaria pallida TaxID=3830 RepID=A0AAN9P6S7_CROPI
MEEDVEENNSNEIYQGKSCDSVLIAKSGDSYVKSTGSRSALSDLTNTINASRRRLKTIFQNNGDDRFVRFLSKDFEDISVFPSSLNSGECSSTRKRSCNLDDQSINLTIGGDSKQRKLEQQLDLLHWNEENNANFEEDKGTNIGHNIAQNMDATPKTRSSNNKENVCTSAALGNIDIPEFLHCSQENSANFEGEVGTKIDHDIPQDSYATSITRRSVNKENVCTSTGLGNIDIPESSSSRKRRCFQKDKQLRLGQELVTKSGPHRTCEMDEGPSCGATCRRRRRRAGLAPENERQRNIYHQLVVRTQPFQQGISSPRITGKHINYVE